jgi:hypothetical protein
MATVFLPILLPSLRLVVDVLSCRDLPPGLPGRRLGV